MALTRRQKLTIGVLICYWPALFVLAHIPVPQLVRRAHVSDKSLHFIAYLILVFLLWFAISPYRKVNWRKARAWWVLLAVVCYGIADELLQGFIGGRSCDARDFLANLAGTLTGLILFSVLNFWLVSLIVVGITIFALTNIARVNVADLVPFTNAMFHFFGYGFFTVVWIRCIYLFLGLKAFSTKWFITALALPMGFLLGVKIFSVVLGRELLMQDVVIAVAGVATTVFLVYLIGLFRFRGERF